MAGSVRLTTPTGARVSVDADKVTGLLRRGFNRVEEPKAPAKKAPAKKTAAKKATAKKSSK